jgi:hypothetical protein
MESSAKRSFRELSVIQGRFSNVYMAKHPDVLGVRIRRPAKGPILIEVKCADEPSGAAMGLPKSFDGLPVVCRVGSPSAVAVSPLSA